jgi:hypothetical protein
MTNDATQSGGPPPVEEVREALESIRTADRLLSGAGAVLRGAAIQDEDVFSAMSEALEARGELIDALAKLDTPPERRMEVLASHGVPAKLVDASLSVLSTEDAGALADVVGAARTAARSLFAHALEMAPGLRDRVTPLAEEATDDDSPSVSASTRWIPPRRVLFLLAGGLVLLVVARCVFGQL